MNSWATQCLERATARTEPKTIDLPKIFAPQPPPAFNCQDFFGVVALDQNTKNVRPQTGEEATADRMKKKRVKPDLLRNNNTEFRHHSACLPGITRQQHQNITHFQNKEILQVYHQLLAPLGVRKLS